MFFRYKELKTFAEVEAYGLDGWEFVSAVTNKDGTISYYVKQQQTFVDSPQLLVEQVYNKSCN